MEERIKS